MKNGIGKMFNWFLIFALSINMAGCATYQVHPEFKERHKNIKSASIMPPQVEAYILTFQGDKKMLNELMPIMGKTTSDEIEKILAGKGYEIKKLDLSETALSANSELRTSLFHVNELFKKQLEDITKRKKSKFTYTLGPDVNAFSNLANCDILIFVKEDGIKKSAGEIAKDVAKGLAISAACLLIGAIYIPIPQTAATVVHFAIVDANDGAVLWYNNNACNANYDPENQRQLSALLKSLVSPFPDSAFKNKDNRSKLAEETKPVSVSKEIAPVIASPAAH